MMPLLIRTALLWAGAAFIAEALHLGDREWWLFVGGWTASLLVVSH